MKRPASQNKRIGVLPMAFRARKVFGTFEKRAPGPSIILWVCYFLSQECACVVELTSYIKLAVILKKKENFHTYPVITCLYAMK